MFQAYFEVFLLIVGGGELMTIENPSLKAYGYQLLPLSTSYLVGNNEILMFQTYLVSFIVGGEELITIEDP